MKKTWKKQMLDILFGFVVFYAGIMVFLYFAQRNLMYFPGGPREPIEQLTQTLPETITINPEEGIELQGFYWPAQNNKPTIVFFHGNGQAYQYWMNKLKIYYEQGYGAYFTDYRGYGGQPGKPTEQGIYQDARTYIKTLKDKAGLQDEDLIFYGESLGTGVAIQMATEFSPKALILESAYSATIDVAKSRYWMFPADFLMKDQFLSREKIPNLTMPKFFIHGEKDMIIPIRFGKKLFEAAAEPKIFKKIPNSGHNDLYDHGAQLHILDFLSTLK